jgi:hypothetical protein
MSPAQDADRDASPEQHDIHSPPHAEQAGLKSGEQEQAAQMIQRNYRGYRTRRQLNGMGLDAESRWDEVRHSILPVSTAL